MTQDPKKLTRAHKIALGIISLACCCIIGISAFALVAPDAVSELTSQQTEQADEQAQQQNTASPDEGTPADGSEAGEVSNEGDSSSQDNANSSSDSSNNGSHNGSGSGNSGSSSSQGGNSSSGSGQSGSSSSGDGSSSSQGSTDSSTVTVSVSVSSSAADGRVSGSAAPTFEKGATAYDALCATGLSVTSKSSQYGIYVSAIGGLAEFEYGGSSGWMYSVNGSAPNVSCGKYVLKDGDRVSWYYVV